MGLDTPQQQSSMGRCADLSVTVPVGHHRWLAQQQLLSTTFATHHTDIFLETLLNLSGHTAITLNYVLLSAAFAKSLHMEPIGNWLAPKLGPGQYSSLRTPSRAVPLQTKLAEIENEKKKAPTVNTTRATRMVLPRYQ